MEPDWGDRAVHAAHYKIGARRDCLALPTQRAVKTYA